jgi:DNA (cytosine-5)-methyltransferase 1
VNVLDLFSGIGGFSLGLERAGMRTVAFCEIDPFCQRVLAKHWPDVPVWGDIRTLTASSLADTIGMRKLQSEGGEQNERGRLGDCGVDLICGGFPCQDISVAGKGAGIEGSRSGLWSEYARVIGEVRPRYVIVENVAALLGRGLDRVLGDLAALGFDAEWHCIPASAVGAPHRRDRVWIVAYSKRGGFKERGIEKLESVSVAPSREDVADSDGEGLSLSGPESIGANGIIGGRLLATSNWWSAEPDVGRVANGIPARVDRLRSLGNAVVPQIPEIIGRAIMECNQRK